MKLPPEQISILIVDDDSDTRSVLRFNLELLNFRKITEVSRADDVTATCATHQPHVIFLDIDLDGGSGLDLIGQILKANSERHVVMVSAHNTVDNVKKAIDEGARGFIVKPFTTAKIKNAIENAYDRVSASRQTNHNQSEELDLP